MESDDSSSGSSSDAPEEVPMTFKGKAKEKTAAKDTKKTDVTADSDTSESDEQDEGVEDEPEEDDEVAAVKKELANLPFEELQKLKNKLGMKVYNRAIHGNKDVPSNPRNRKFKRENKNRPQEISSKVPVKELKPAIQVKKKKLTRDPRFDDLSGEFSEDHFSKNYSFLDDVKSREKEKLLKRMEKEKDEEKRKNMKFLVGRMDQQEKVAKEKQKRKELETTIKQKEKEMVSQGKTPYYLKKSDKRKLELAEKYKELKKSGKLENYLAKKRKKTASKDRKHMPDRHFRTGDL